MGTYLCVATLPHRDGFARDDVKMSAVFVDVADTPDLSLAKMRDFFTVTQPVSVKKVAQYIGNSRTRSANGCFVSAFDLTGHLDGSPHGSAISTLAFTLAAPEDTPSFPSEVAACVSFRTNAYTGALEVGGEEALPTPAAAVAMGAPATHVGRSRPRARQRGRMFVGPLASHSATADAGDGRVRLNDDFRTTLLQAAAALAAPGDPNPPAVGVAQLQVWSRRNESTFAVTNVLVDDGFDIQRRRGEKAVNRSSIAL